MRMKRLLICSAVVALLALAVAAPAPDRTASARGAGAFDALAAVAGRAEAWYQLNGYVTAPPPAADSPFWPTSTPLAYRAPVTEPLTNTLYLPLVINASGEPIVERRAVWVTRYDWTGLAQAPAPEKIDEIVANVAGAGFNTIFFQVRAAGDAYYTPGLEPWAARLTAGPTTTETLGQDPGWDPLARMLEAVHAAGLEIHAYVNVYPAWLSPPGEAYGHLWPPATTPPQMFDRFTYGPTYLEHPGVYGLGYTWRHYDDTVTPMPLAWNSYLWASPGVDQVQDYLVAVVCDIVTRYAVDGVHLDLVRYAGPRYSYDPFSNAATGTLVGEARDQWQRDRVTALVHRVYTETQILRSDAWVSAAVWPYYVDNWGWGLSEGYTDYFQDSKGWLSAGVIDAIAPMLYGSVADDFDRWRILAEDFLAGSAGRHVYPGIAGYYDDFDAITQRIQAARQAGAPGHVLFSYGALNSRGYWDDLAAGPYAIPAILPERP